MNNTRPTLEALMHSVNSKRWPARWESFYDRVMDEYEKNGCPFAEPSYYDGLAEKYNMLPNFLEDYKAGAAAVKEDDSLCRVLMLICESLKDRKNIASDIRELELPHSQDGGYSIKYDMLTALAMASAARYQHSLYTARSLPQEHIDYGMRHLEGMVRNFKSRNNGRSGAMSWEWYQLGIDAKIYRIGRLEIEIFAKFTQNAIVYENSKGEVIALANNVRVHREGYILGSAHYKDEEGAWEASVTEDELFCAGYPYIRRGVVSKGKIRLAKDEWRRIIEPGDPVVSLHIPAGGGFTDEAIDKCFADSKEFLAKYFPDFDYKAFVCSSWLMDDMLSDMIGENKNISKFCERFSKIGQRSAGRAVFSFVFLQPDVNNVDYNALPENSTLERELKKHYIDGKAIYECYGFIAKDNI
ncbi:MAG: hypothetical protein J6M35_10515 [Clostridia bacterium]|nr:hypothetical protein [Clostridia bacterium]